MFKKPKRNFRLKARDGNSDEENEPQKEEEDVAMDTASSVQEGTASVKKKKKKKPDKTTSKSSTLSFGDDLDEADGEVFKVKKSSHSRRIAKQLKKQSLKLKREEEGTEEDGSTSPKLPIPQQYSEQALKELKKAQDEANGRVEGRDRDSDSGEDEDEPSTAVRNILESGGIPDAAMIHMARKRRQMAREMGDFIPVDDTVKVENAKSRLVREDDNDMSDEDERVNFSINKKEEELRKMQDTFLAAEHGSNSEGSDQEREWEEQQIRKGVAVAAGSGPAPTEKQEPGYYGNMQQYMYGQQSNIFNPNMPVYDMNNQYSSGRSLGTRVQGQVQGKLPEVNMASIKKRLTDRLESLTGVHRNHVTEKDSIDSRLESSESFIENSEDSSKTLEDHYRFFQETRGYVRDLVDCLSEKMPVIISLEKRVMNMLKQRSDRLVKRRQQDIKDQSLQFMPGKSAATPSPPVPYDVQRRIAEREARRARRRRAREAQSIKDHNEGLSTDDEENQSEITKFTLERDRVDTETESLFQDVVDEYIDLDLVKHYFERWKLRHRDTYEEAYIGLCLPKLFTPLVRLKLLEWNPLQSHNVNFEHMTWYESLMFYGHMIDPKPDPDDQDVKLVPTIVEKAIVVRLTELVENVWDPMSSQETLRLVKCVMHLVETYPTVSADSPKTKALFEAVVKRIRKTLDDDVFMPLYPKQTLENKNAGATVYFNRQCWSCIKLMNNILMWHSLLSDTTLRELALDSLLRRYLMLGIQSSPVNPDVIRKCQVMVSAFPKKWFSDLRGEQTILGLATFAKCLVNMADHLQQEMDNAKDSTTKKAVRDNIKQISKMLVSIGAMEQAITVGTKACLKV